MVQPNEIVMLFLGIGIYFFMLTYKNHYKHLPENKLFIRTYQFLLIAWAATVFEGFFWSSSLNFLEHLCYALSSLLLMTWCGKLITSKQKKE